MTTNRLFPGQADRPPDRPDRERAAAKRKKPYLAPELRIYGSVVDFTKGSMSVGHDLGFGNSRKNSRSERQVKENIKRVGTHPLGIGIYLFNYRAEFRDEWGRGRQLGVMAEEVERVLPRAVSISLAGDKIVDYHAIGVILFDDKPPPERQMATRVLKSFN